MYLLYGTLLQTAGCMINVFGCSVFMCNCYWNKRSGFVSLAIGKCEIQDMHCQIYMLMNQKLVMQIKTGLIYHISTFYAFHEANTSKCGGIEKNKAQ